MKERREREREKSREAPESERMGIDDENKPGEGREILFLPSF